MTTYILYLILKFLLVSVVLWIIFRFLIRNRSSYLAQRLFLLSIPVMAAALSLISFETFGISVDKHKPMGSALISVANVSQFDYDVVPFAQQESSTESNIAIDYESPIEYSEEQGSPAPKYSSSISAPQDGGNQLPYVDIVLWLWLFVALYFIGDYLHSLGQINRLRRASKRYEQGGVYIYRSQYVDGPFSFFRSVFINSILSGEKYDIILKHESAHIQSRHFVDKSIIEIYTILLWFNPVVWIIRREICAIHEFQADSVVLCDGYNVKEYKHFIFEEAVGGTPSISNGFNNSLIKQRFLQMKESYQMKSSWFTRIVTVLAVSLLFVVVSCTFVRSNAEVEVLFSDITAQKENATVEIKLKDGTIKSGTPEEMCKWIGENATLIENINIEKDQKAIDKAYRASLPPHFFLDEDQFHIIAKRDYVPISIYRRNGYTEVDIMYEIYSDYHWTYYTSNAQLKDRKSGDLYNVIGIAEGKPLNQRLVIKKNKGKFAMHTLIFPEIKAGVEYLDYIGGELPDSLKRPTNTIEKSYSPDIKVNGDIARPYRDERNGAVIKIATDELPNF